MPRIPPKRRQTKIEKASAARAKQKSQSKKVALPDNLNLNRPMPVAKFAAAYGVDPSTIWRGLKSGRLKFVVVNQRRLVLPPAVEQENASG